MPVCEAGESVREELQKLPPLSPAVLQIVNVYERKPRQKKTVVENIEIQSMKYIYDHINIKPFFKQIMPLIILIHIGLADLDTKILPLR